MDNIRKLPTKNEVFVKDTKEWLNKSMQDTTIGDNLTMHVAGEVISIVVRLTFSGWIGILHKTKEKLFKQTRKEM